ncbi:MAG TPA: hypothetical protein VIJ65_09705 [Acidobacteriaceae bacterium]
MKPLMNPSPPHLAALAAAALLLAILTPSSTQAQTHTQPQTHPKTHASSPCSLLALEKINALVGTPVQPGQPGPNDCTWHDAKGQTVVYLTLRDSKDWHFFHSQMQSTGRLVPVTGVAEDAFFVSSTGSSAAFYALKSTHVLLLTVDGLGFTKAQNEAAEQALAVDALARL